MSSTLFALLDTCIAADQGPPGFRAKIAICVLAADDAEWWVADFGREVQTSRPTSAPDGCDTVLFLGGDEATRLLEGRSLGRQPRTFSIVGDPRHLVRFNKRYVDRKNIVGIRLGVKP